MGLRVRGWGCAAEGVRLRACGPEGVRLRACGWGAGRMPSGTFHRFSLGTFPQMRLPQLVFLRLPACPSPTHNKHRPRPRLKHRCPLKPQQPALT